MQFAPLFFLNKIKALYISIIHLEIGEDFLKISGLDVGAIFFSSRKPPDEIILGFSSIKSVKFKNIPYKYCEFCFYLKEMKMVCFSFLLDSKLQPFAIVDGFLDELLLKISQHTKNLQTDHKIVLKPSFYASKVGLICILILLLIFFTVLIFVVLNVSFVKIRSLLITLLLIIQIVSRRVVEKKFYFRNESKLNL
ncbi:hypothetical protein GCM10027566_10890 [Arachidicoccus ginsenosidivorans]